MQTWNIEPEQLKKLKSSKFSSPYNKLFDEKDFVTQLRHRSSLKLLEIVVLQETYWYCRFGKFDGESES